MNVSVEAVTRTDNVDGATFGDARILFCSEANVKRVYIHTVKHDAYAYMIIQLHIQIGVSLHACSELYNITIIQICLMLEYPYCLRIDDSCQHCCRTDVTRLIIVVD